MRTRKPARPDPAIQDETLEPLETSLDPGASYKASEGEQIIRELKARAQALARIPVAEGSTEGFEALEFRLAGERYALESCHIREVFPLENLTMLPGTPPFVLGIANLRGEMVSVIDMGKFFGLPERGLGELNKLIVLSHSEMCFGILADEVIGIRFILQKEILAPLPTLTGIRRDFLKGVMGGHTIILDAPGLMKDKRMVVYEEAGE